MLHYEQVTTLILKLWRAETTQEEDIQIQEWINADPAHPAMLKKFEDDNWIIREMAEHEQGPTAAADKKLWAKWEQLKPEVRPPVTRNRSIRSAWWYGAAAVCIVLLIIYNAVDRPVKKSGTHEVAHVDPANDPSPGRDKAVLHLANGEPYIIGDTTKGYIATQDNLVFTKAGGVVFCKVLPGTPAPKAIRNHTLETPKGGRYQLVLPDGSKVWLNAASRIQFPTIDTGNTRMVYLEGEAYFEVAYNKRRPFIVKVNDANVTVTGTHFNIVSYANESLSMVTLTEGHISVHSGGKDEWVAPAYSAIFSKGSQPRVVKEANIDKIMAWKNKQFFWKQDSLTTALREIARWYDVTVQYEGTPPTTIIKYVVESRNRPLHELMELVTTSDTGDTTAFFELKGRTLIISKNRLH